jgi:hypothetical protein
MAGFELTLYGRIWVTPKDYRALSVQRDSLKDYLLGGPKIDKFEVKGNRGHGTKDPTLTARSQHLLHTNVLFKIRKVLWVIGCHLKIRHKKRPSCWL